jgi:serine/threonine protein phosphatase 1
MMSRTLVIGDIHGCVNTLKELLSKVKIRKGDKIIFLGDYIDRGPFSKQVIDFVRELQANSDYEVIALRGNHEEMCINFYRNPHSPYRDAFLHNGGFATVRSFYSDEETKDSVDVYVSHKVPDEYLDWMNDLPYRYEDEDAYYVHAGFSPYFELEDQYNEDLIWIRDVFLQSHHKWDKPVVHGHTPNNNMFKDDRRIGLDLGCVYSGKLACYDMKSEILWTIPKLAADGES